MWSQPQTHQASSTELELQLLANSTLNEVRAVETEDSIDIVNRGQSDEDVPIHDCNNTAFCAHASGAERRNNLAQSLYRESLRRHGNGMFVEEDELLWAEEDNEDVMIVEDHDGGGPLACADGF